MSNPATPRTSVDIERTVLGELGELIPSGIPADRAVYRKVGVVNRTELAHRASIELPSE